MNSLRQALLNITHTENGALTFRSTLDSVMDFYYHAPAKRGRNEEVVALFQAAYAEQPALALLALFNLRDIRGGKGERASFRACLAWLAEQFVPHYDDLTAFHAHSGVRDTIAEQLRADCASARPSLLAKWMPI